MKQQSRKPKVGSILLMLMLVFTMMPQIAWATDGTLSGGGHCRRPIFD